MKDELGYYYAPTLQNPDVRMYVRDNNGSIEFRLWNRTEPIIWERHQWLPYEVIQKAAEMYKERNTDRNPMALYDLDVAMRILKDG